MGRGGRRQCPPATCCLLLQVTKQGNWVDIHNCPTAVTLGVTSSDPCLPLPNVLLMARWEDAPQGPLEETPVALSRYGAGWG